MLWITNQLENSIDLRNGNDVRTYKLSSERLGGLVDGEDNSTLLTQWTF